MYVTRIIGVLYVCVTFRPVLHVFFCEFASMYVWPSQMSVRDIAEVGFANPLRILGLQPHTVAKQFSDVVSVLVEYNAEHNKFVVVPRSSAHTEQPEERAT